MTKEHTQSNQHGIDQDAAEQQPVSETNLTPTSHEDTTPGDTQAEKRQENKEDAKQEPHPEGDEYSSAGTFEFAEQPAPHVEQETPGEQEAFSFTEVVPPVEEDVSRPFIDFIQEFRQAEEASSINQTPGEESVVREFTAPWQHVSASEPTIAGTTQRVGEQGEQIEPEEPFQAVQEITPTVDAATENVTEAPAEQSRAATGKAEPPAPAERPVSPLLRPASRLRIPRHGHLRQREEQPATKVQQEAKQAAPAPEASPVPEVPSLEEPPRPARRYRFDRPSATTAAQAAPAPARSEEAKEVSTHGPAASVPAHIENKSSTGKAGKQREEHPKQGASPLPEQSSLKQQEAPAGSGSATAAETPARRSANGKDRQREKEVAAPSQSAVAPATENAVTSTGPALIGEVAPEDLPPLEYSELQRASSRRRRRRRSGVDATPAAQAPAAPTTSTIPATKPVVPEQPAAPSQPPASIPPAGQTRSVIPASTPPASVPAAGPYNIISGYTISQMNQTNDSSSPFMSPEPSPARGSHPVRGSLRAVRPEQRPQVYPARTGDPALNQFANVVVQAIQAQTDRMVTELRRTNQVPTNVSVSLPALPSTERVGVFVDVANLLYSARTLRITIDFGKLLDFLRGNRRLVRAHAYCPTSPQSGDEQMFLQAVKGLGYRITTKNYKTFSSGAKKADLDLDLCMDVVRLVEGKAVDCVVLVSGDSDFMPMLDYCSDHGVRVEVAAFDEAMSATLRQSCDLFINLAMLEDIRA